MLLTVPQGEEWHLYSLIRRSQQGPELPLKVPKVQAEANPPGPAQRILPVVVELKPGAELSHQKQYFIPHKAQVGIQKHLERLVKYGILHSCQSSWNIPLLPIQKPGTEDYQLVQDLWAVN